MFFWLKKLIGYCILPVPVCLGLFALGALLVLTKRRAHLGRVLFGLGALLLLLFSNKFISQSLVRPLEARHPPVPELQVGNVPAELARCQFVAVLGAGNGNTPDVAAINLLSPSARARVTEAARILRVVPSARLLVSGPVIGRHASHATVLERAAISLGVEPSRIQRIEIVRDTEDESLAIKRIAGDAPVAVVTSAWHMPRAVALCRSASVNVVPCPTDFTAHDDGHFHWRDFLFDVESIERSTCAIREYAGGIWIRLRGKNGA